MIRAAGRHAFRSWRSDYLHLSATVAAQGSAGSSRFAGFVVEAAAPSWLSHASVGGVGLLAAGRRVRVIAGRAEDLADPPVTAEVRQFLGYLAGDPAGVRLPPEGVDLRLIRPDGRIIPCPQVPADASSMPTALSILRAADGTGLVFLQPDAAAAAGSQLPPGIYRLGWTYRRDNRAVDAASIVLREHSDSTAERVTIDVRI